MTTYTFKMSCGNLKNIIRNISADNVMTYLDSLAQAQLEKEGKGTASIFIVDVIRNVEGKDPVSVRNSVLTAYYAALREAKNVCRQDLLRVQDNPIVDTRTGKTVGFYEVFPDDEGRKIVVYYKNGLVRFEKTFEGLDQIEELLMTA